MREVASERSSRGSGHPDDDREDAYCRAVAHRDEGGADPTEPAEDWSDCEAIV